MHCRATLNTSNKGTIILLTSNVVKTTKAHQHHSPHFAPTALLHTVNHISCQACERESSGAPSVITAETPFLNAASAWLDQCTSPSNPGTVSGRYIKENTEVSYRQYCESLALFFATMPLGTIRPENMRGYQRARLAGADPFIRRRRPHEEPAPSPVKAKKVNQELAILRRIMIEGGAWTEELARQYRRLLEDDEDDTPQRALEPDEQELWLRTAASKEEWQIVHWYSLLGIGQTLGTNELQWMRVGDVNLFHQATAVAGKGVKGPGRKRSISILTAEALWAAEQLLERAKQCGSTSPQHYLLPFRILPYTRYEWDPTRPMSTSGIKREWQEVRVATGLLFFRQYDLRHTGGTNLAREGWRPEMIRARMGHLTEKMRQHYTHISDAAQRREHERVTTLRFAPRKFEPRAERQIGFERRVVSRE